MKIITPYKNKKRINFVSVYEITLNIGFNNEKEAREFADDVSSEYEEMIERLIEERKLKIKKKDQCISLVTHTEV